MYSVLCTCLKNVGLPYTLPWLRLVYIHITKNKPIQAFKIKKKISDFFNCGDIKSSWKKIFHYLKTFEVQQKDEQLSAIIFHPSINGVIIITESPPLNQVLCSSHEKSPKLCYVTFS